MKKVLAMILCMTMLLSVVSVAAFAADAVKVVEATLIDPKDDYNDNPKFIFDGLLNTAVTYSWNDVDAVRGALLELENAVTLESCTITWGNPSWETYDMAAIDYTVSVSADGEEYTEIYKAAGVEGLGTGMQRTDTLEFETPAENVKFVKLTITKCAGYYLGLAEVQFNKSKSASTASSSETSSEAESSVAATSSAAASSEVTSSAAAVSSEAASSAATSSQATSSEAASSAATSSQATSSAATSSAADSSVTTTDNEPKNMTWLWIVIAAVAVVAIVVIVLASKKKK